MAKVVAIDTDVTPTRAVVIVECPGMTLRYEIVRPIAGKGSGTHVSSVRLSSGSRVPHRDGVATARRVADAAMAAKRDQLDAKYPLAAAARKAR